MGALPGSGVLAGGPPNAASTPRRQILSLVRVGPSRQTNPTNFELYPTFTLLQQSLAAPTPCATARSQVDAADATFLDEDFQECWWCFEREGIFTFIRGWATKQGERALVYIAGGGLWSGTQEE